MPSPARLLPALAALLLAGCGGQSGGSSDVETATSPGEGVAVPAEPKCVKAPPAVVKAIEKTLTDPIHLRRARAVRSSARPPGAIGEGGVWFVSAKYKSKQIKPGTVGTWAVSGKLFSTGQGKVLPASFDAFSKGGTDAAERAGLDATARGYAESRGCLTAR